jgi:hypothetical protein
VHGAFYPAEWRTFRSDVVQLVSCSYAQALAT